MRLSNEGVGGWGRGVKSESPCYVIYVNGFDRLEDEYYKIQFMRVGPLCGVLATVMGRLYSRVPGFEYRWESLGSLTPIFPNIKRSIANHPDWLSQFF